ncbi:hypothetical protein AB0L40_02395 [Patulibacter sp. NPDC049589]|uniref:hypothetical protein n=1 Tax=Patulibacter sp. NPDC049589 TaxID=3154731 RepID=UPI00342896E8
MAPPTWFLSLLAVALSWPTWSSLVPAVDLDSAWQGALHLAAQDRLAYGRDLEWTYGPLGFLLFPQMWSSGTGAAALLTVTLLRLLTAALVVAAARDRGGWGAATLGAWAALLLTPNEMLAVPATFAAAVVLRGGCATRRRFLVAASAAGAFVGLQMLVKFSTGPFVALLVVVALLGAARAVRDRGLALAAASTAGVLAAVVGCLVVGQPIGALPSMLRWGMDLAGGYGEAMGYADPALAHEVPFAIAVGIGGLAVASLRTADRSPLERTTTALLWLLVWFAAFRSGFLRHDGGHALQFTGTIAAALVLLPWTRLLRLLPVAIVLVVLVVADGELEGGVGERMNPVRNASAALEQVSVLARPDERRRLEDQGRRAIVVSAGLRESTVALLRRGTATVYPASLGVLWAHRLRWRSLPVMQAHMAYTPGLDRLDADALRSARAPERILVESDATAVGRFPAFDEPQASLAMLCRYGTERRDGRWLVLRRLDVDRCGRPVSRGRSAARWGSPVSIPRPRHADGAIVARVRGAGVQGLERLRTTVLRAHGRTVSIGGRRGLLVPGTAAGGVLLSVPESAGRTGRFAVVPLGRTVTFAKEGGGGRLAIEWSEVRVGGSGRAVPDGSAAGRATMGSRPPASSGRYRPAGGWPVHRRTLSGARGGPDL